MIHKCPESVFSELGVRASEEGHGIERGTGLRPALFSLVSCLLLTAAHAARRTNVPANLGMFSDRQLSHKHEAGNSKFAFSCLENLKRNSL